MPSPESITSRSAQPPSADVEIATPTRRRVPQRVRDEVSDHLREPPLVALDQQLRVPFGAHLDALGCGHACALHLPLRERGQVERLHGVVERPGLDSGELLEVVDQPGQVLEVLDHRVEPFGRARQHALGHGFSLGSGRCDRVSELVGHVSDEPLAELLGFLERVGHRVERLAESRDFGRSPDVHAMRQSPDASSRAPCSSLCSGRVR